MDFEDLTMADLQRLVAALKSIGGEDIIERIVANTVAAITPHGRVTMGMVQKLLNQTNGCTILPAEAVACLQLTEALPSKAKTCDNHETVLAALAKRAIASGWPKLTPKQNVTVGSNQPKLFKELVAACKFVQVDQNFTSEHFPLEAMPTELTVLKGCSFTKAVSAVEVIAALHNNERLVGIGQALKYVAENPRLVPPRGNLVILGARWLNDNDQQEYVPIIYHYTGWRDRIEGLCLGLTSIALKFGESCEFLVEVDHFYGVRR